MGVMLQHRYNLSVHEGEKGGGEKLVESAGYIPADVQIEQMIMAGQRLGDFRRENYDYDLEEEPIMEDMDPTRSPNFDLADASQIGAALAAKVETDKAAAPENAAPSVEEPSKEDA